MKKYILFIFLLCTIHFSFAQKVTIEGYAFEEDNRGFLNEVAITVYSSINAIKAETTTNKEGFFSVELNPNEEYKIKATKDIFENTFVEVKADELKAGKTHYVKIEMKRKPGYLFDVTLAESELNEEGYKNAIAGASIEVYNNTRNEEVINLQDYKDPNFQVTFEQGNHYTVMIRKKGFFTKRMEAHVNIDGCILCFEGVGQVMPDISDNLTEGHTMGTLLANVEMDRVKVNKEIAVENIYYDYNEWNIREDASLELDKLITILKDNPNFIIELGSHTDSRGKDPYNLSLSKKRARAAVEYIVTNGKIPRSRISARGYGETKLTNKCANGIECSEEEHQLNRRTTIKVTGFVNEDESIVEEDKSLKDIRFEKELDNFDFDDAEVVEMTNDDEIAAEIARDLERQKQREIERKKRLEELQNKNNPKEEIKKENIEIKEEELNDNSSIAGAFGEDIEVKISEKEEEIEPKKEEVEKPKKSITDNYIPKGAKKLADDYNGFMIEFFNSGIELSPDHSIFKQYGKVKYEQKEDGDFAYLIGGFDTEKEANGYLEKIIQPRFPTAKVIEYENGKRK